MRIAILSWESVHSIYVGGVAVHVSELAKSLQLKGHDVHVFTRMGQFQSLVENVDGVFYHRCMFELTPNFIEEINNMCRSIVSAVFETEDFGGSFDVIHAHDWLTANALNWIKQGRNRKTVLTMHSTEYGRCGNNFGGGNSESISRIEWEGIYHANKVIAVSNTLKNELNWLYSLTNGKVDVIYNGVNCEAFNGWIDHLAVRKMYEIGPHDPIILFTGRMVYQKGPDILAETIPRILRHYQNAKFVFAGDGGMRAHIEGLVRQMGIFESTRFLGHLSGWRLTDLFKTADCICVPSRNEPFGIVILEAWSAGKPVVASVNGGPSEFVWHEINGYKVFANPDSIEWGLGNLLNDMDHAHWMGHNGRKTAEEMFSWHRIADETLNVYHN